MVIYMINVCEKKINNVLNDSFYLIITYNNKNGNLRIESSNDCSIYCKCKTRKEILLCIESFLSKRIV
jgi:hypothetical protein